MFCKQLFYIVILTTAILSSDSRTIQDSNSRPDIENNITKASEQPASGNLDSRMIEHKQSKNEAINDNSCNENCIEKKNSKAASKSSRFEASCPYKSKDLCLIFSLSKIAKVQVATPNVASSTRSLKLNLLDGASTNAKNSHVSRRIKEDEEFSEQAKNEDFQKFSQKRMKSSNVHCRATRDVYIPEVKQNMPAFACKFRNNTFILSSTRFLQDRRLYLDVKVDESVFKNIQFRPKISRNNEFNVISASLILNLVNNDYRVELREHAVNEQKVNQITN